MLYINYSSAVGMSVIDGGGGLSALRMIGITVEWRYVSNSPPVCTAGMTGFL